jgi:hypothetical protein
MIREYMILRAKTLPATPGYFCARKGADCPIYPHIIDDIFDNLIIYADNEVFALIKAIDILIEQEVSGVSYQEIILLDCNTTFWLKIKPMTIVS